MTDYTAYDAGLPCRNPSCKSHGRPHPNCRCYGDFAEGGEAYFCASNRPHQAGCEYFAAGGEADEIPESEMPGDQPAPAPAPAPGVFGGASDDVPDEIPESAMPDAAPDEIPESAMPDYTTPLQQEATKYESLAQGALGPIATGAELGLSKLGVPGFSAQDIAGRQAANPGLAASYGATGTGLSFLTGVGEAGLVAKAAEALPKLEKMGLAARAGAAAVKGFITNGLVQGGDEISKAMLGQGDPQDPVGAALAHVGIAGLFGAAGEAAGAGLKAAADLKISTRFNNAMAGIGDALAGKEMGAPLPAHDNAGYRDGFKWASKNLASIAGGAGGATAGFVQGYHDNGVVGAIKGLATGAVEGAVLATMGKAAVGAGKYAAPTVIRLMSSSPVQGVVKAMEHAQNVSRGAAVIDGSVEALFRGTTSTAAKNAGRIQDKIRDWVESGGPNQILIDQRNADNAPAPAAGYADGGVVTPTEAAPDSPAGPVLDETDGVANHFPEQNMLMAAAHGRIYSYLQAKRPPKDAPRLAFDDEPDHTEAKRAYDSAIEVAADPMSIMRHIGAGTVEPDHIQHLSAMYPETANLLRKKATERIVKAQLKDERPPYHVRQGLSMLLGTALSGEITPQAVAAAQAVYAKPQQQQGGGAQKAKHGTAPLSKSSEAYLTSDQARGRRQQAAH